MHELIRGVFLLMLTLVVVACNPSGDPPPESKDQQSSTRERVAYASVVITAPKIGQLVDFVDISPKDASLSTGESFLFTAVALDAKGKPVGNVDFQWNINDPLVGTITPSGLFTTGIKPGTYLNAVEVSATSGTKTVNAVANVEVLDQLEAQNRILNSIVLYPPNVTLRPGQMIGISALGWDDQGRLVQGLRFRWEMIDNDAGTVDQFGFFTASQLAGHYPNAIQVTATRNTLNGVEEDKSFVSVTVTNMIDRGILAQVVAIPGAITLVPEQRLRLQARALDESGQLVKEVSLDWEVLQSDAGFLEDTGYFVAGNETGQYPNAIQAMATQQTPEGLVQVRTNIAVTVEPPKIATQLTKAHILPTDVTLKPGQHFVFIVYGLDSAGNRVYAREDWETIDSDAGMVTQHGVFTAGLQHGNYDRAIRVQLSQDTSEEAIVVDSFANVNILGPLETVTIDPNILTVAAEQSVTMHGIGSDMNGLTIPSLRFKWSIEDASAGSINEFGVFSAGTTPGIYENAIKVIAVELDPP